jgi:hypothetical protein
MQAHIQGKNDSNGAEQDVVLPYGRRGGHWLCWVEEQGETHLQVSRRRARPSLPINTPVPQKGNSSPDVKKTLPSQSSQGGRQVQGLKHLDEVGPVQRDVQFNGIPAFSTVVVALVPPVFVLLLSVTGETKASSVRKLKT